MTNLKMQHSGLVDCPEVEQLRRCRFFDTKTCPHCYSELLWKLRRADTHHPPNKKHIGTKKHGLVRLGTYIEVTEKEWTEFKNGEGLWDCCGRKWSRPDFRVRKYFLITRGMEPGEFYRAVLADDACVNVQVSVDVFPDGHILPSKERLKWFLEESPKVIFRFKTTPTNVVDFVNLRRALGIPYHRIMETPLRTPSLSHIYGTATPLEKYWDWKEFGRCNTTCRNCKYENGFLLCAANQKMLPRLATITRGPPPRHRSGQLSPKGRIWKREAIECMMAHGGSCSVQEAYAWFLDKYPVLKHGKPNWEFKVRVALQRAGTKSKVATATWDIRPAYRTTGVLMRLTEFIE